MVCVFEAMLALRLEERRLEALRPGVVVRRMWCVEPTGRQRGEQFGELAGFELPGVRTWRPCKTGYAGSGL